MKAFKAILILAEITFLSLTTWTLAANVIWSFNVKNTADGPNI